MVWFGKMSSIAQLCQKSAEFFWFFSLKNIKMGEQVLLMTYFDFVCRYFIFKKCAQILTFNTKSNQIPRTYLWPIFIDHCHRPLALLIYHKTAIQVRSLYGSMRNRNSEIKEFIQYCYYSRNVNRKIKFKILLKN